MNMGKGLISRLFGQVQKPRKEFLTYAIMLSWHPAVGIGVLDPISGRHFAHQPGTSVIKSLKPPAKVAADYFPVGVGYRTPLPPNFQLTHTITDRQLEGQQHTVTVERVEVAGAFAQPFVYERILDPQAGKVTSEARMGDISNRHQAVTRGPLVKYIDTMRAAALQRMAKTGAKDKHLA